jgi:hypothetical protein
MIPNNLEPGNVGEDEEKEETKEEAGKRPKKITKKRGKQFLTRRPQSTRQRLDELWRKIGRSKERQIVSNQDGGQQRQI